MALSTFERLRRQDRKLIRYTRSIKVLTTLGWRPHHERAFLKGLRAGRPQLPRVELPQVDLSEQKAELSALRRRLDTDHPAGAFLDRTAASFLEAAEMLEAAGTPAFTEIAQAIYGRPTDPIHPGSPSHLEAAEHFISVSEGCSVLPEGQRVMKVAEARAWMTAQLAPLFVDEPLPVVATRGLTPLATAGWQRVRLRADAQFTEIQLAQLLQHEALVHAATKRNGRAQPLLTSLGLSAPRTTSTQEGLATLAEMITDTMDLRRLRRIALRIRALHAALEGADFIQVFRIFEAAGQDPSESFNSAARIFRGGDVRGRVVFTKDLVYLKGMMSTHTFLLKAIQSGHNALPLRLFAGRMTLGDALALEPLFESGELIPPRVAPSWVTNRHCLAAYLSWAAFNNRIQLHCLSLDDFREL